MQETAARVVLGTLVMLALHGAVSRTARASGIVVSDPARQGRVKLTHHDVRATLDDHVAHVTVEHTFRSRAQVPMEGVYLFPLPEGAVVNDFAMTMGDKMVRGEVLDAQQARDIYNSIVRRRKDPGLLEYVGRGLFRASVFPIPSGGEVKVRLKFQQVLRKENGTAEFRYPLATDRLNGSPVATTHVAVDVRGQNAIESVYCPSHDLLMRRHDEKYTSAKLTAENRRQDRDLLLYVHRGTNALGLSVISHKSAYADGTFMALLSPLGAPSEGDEGEVPKDVVFVLDTSTSMAGPQLRQARAAVTYGIRTLRPGDRFDVISFASAAKPFRGGLVNATIQQQEAAVAWLNDLVAVGSTNMEAALTRALDMHVADRLSIVVFLTDGRPTVGTKDADKLLRQVLARNESKARVFTFGVGHDLDVALLDRIAEGTRGVRDYVEPNEDIEAVTGRFFDKIRKPMMTDVRIEFGAGAYDVYPAEMPDLFAGSEVVLYGRYRSPGPTAITLTGTISGEHIRREYATTLADSGRADYLPRLWANRKVAYLLDQVRLHGADEEIEQELVRLGTRYAVVTPYTSGLVVEDVAPDPGPAFSPLAQMGGLRRPPPTTPPSTPPSSPTQVSQDLKRRKSTTSASSALPHPSRVKLVGDKTFIRHSDGRWTDTAWDDGTATTKVKVFSTAYFDLLERQPGIAKYLAVAARVVVLYEGTPYEVVVE